MGVKKAITNKDLSDAIRNLDLFEPGSVLPNVVVNTILRCIKQGTFRDGFTTIPGLGKFHRRYIQPKFAAGIWVGGPNKKRIDKFLPAKTVIKFTTCRRLMRELRDKEN